MRKAAKRRTGRRSGNRRTVEPPAWKRIFGRKCINAALAAVFLGLLGTWLFRLYQGQETRHMVGEAKETMYNSIYSSHSTLELGAISEAEFWQTLRYEFANWYRMRGIVFELYKKTDGALMADSGTDLFVLTRTTDEIEREWCEVEQTEAFRNFLERGREKLQKEYGGGTEEWRSVQMEVEDIWRKGNTFLPGTIRMLYQDTVILERNLTPQDTDGYEHDWLLPQKGKISGTIPAGEGRFALWIPGWERESSTLKDLQRVRERQGNGEPVRLSNGNIGYVNQIVLSGADGIEEYLLYTVGDAEKYRFHIRSLLPAYLVLGLVCLFTAWVTSRFQYIRDRANYEIFRYQQELTGAMAHDLKTPLMTISGYAESLAGNVHTEKREEYARGVLEGVQYMDQLVNSILQFSKMEFHITAPQKSRTQVEVLLQNILQELNGAVLGKQLTVTVEGTATLVTDERTLKQALGNLLQNAVRYAPQQGQIRIVLSKEQIQIENTISGPLSKPVSELRKPFVRGRQERGEMQGSGLGLAIADRSLEQLGYTLTLVCEAGVFTALVEFTIYA